MTSAFRLLAASILAGLILMTCPVNNFHLVHVIPVSTLSTVDLAVYEVTIYVNGTPFTGLTTVYSGSTESLTTFYGSFSDIQILGYSNFTVSHPVEGSIAFSKWISYSDNQGNTLKTEKAQSYNLVGAPEMNTYTEREYGNYQMVQASDNILEKSYSERYHVNGVLQEINDCRYSRNFQFTEVVTSLPGREFECNYYETSIYSNNSLSEYTLWWWNIPYDALVKLERYDGKNTLMMTMILSEFSSDPTGSILEFLVMTGIFILPFVIPILFIIYLTKKSARSRNYYLRCPECRTPLDYTGKYCIYCGKELDQSR